MKIFFYGYYTVCVPYKMHIIYLQEEVYHKINTLKISILKNIFELSKINCSNVHEGYCHNHVIQF